MDHYQLVLLSEDDFFEIRSHKRRRDGESAHGVFRRANARSFTGCIIMDRASRAIRWPLTAEFFHKHRRLPRAALH